MRRDFIVVLGLQGFGKSVWTKLYSLGKKRRLVFCPMASYPGVDFVTDPETWLPPILNATDQTAPFSFGTYLREEIPMFGHAAFAAGNCALIVEESSLIFNRGEQLQDWAKPLVFMGRHRRVDLILVAQRATKIPIDIRSQATRLITFRQSEPDDIDAIADKIGKQYAPEIATLPELECLDWADGAVSRYRVRP